MLSHGSADAGAGAGTGACCGANTGAGAGAGANCAGGAPNCAGGAAPYGSGCCGCCIIGAGPGTGWAPYCVAMPETPPNIPSPSVTRWSTELICGAAAAPPNSLTGAAAYAEGSSQGHEELALQSEAMLFFEAQAGRPGGGARTGGIAPTSLSLMSSASDPVASGIVSTYC